MGKRFAIIGGGLGGALLANHLGRAGLEVDLYERRADPSAGDFIAGGRSINLAISVRGIHALAQVGLADEILQAGVPMRGRCLHLPDGQLAYQPYDKDPARCIHSVSRGVLNSVTIEAARKLPNVRVHFERRCTDVELDAPAAILRGPDGATERAACDVLVGFDGAYSAVRRAMERVERSDFSQHTLAHGYKELSIPAGADGQHRMRREALHIWPRRSFMMIALPNADGSFTCTLFYPHEGPESFAELQSDEAVARLFERQFPDAVPLMPTLADDFRQNPTGTMVTMRCRPWHVGGRVVLGGDAAHAVVPFYGQGANAAFEDVTVLMECIARRRGEREQDWEGAMRAYESARRENADALADLAIGNFIEMRDHTASRLFHLRKKWERTLHTCLPRWYTPLYALVSFTRTPYAEAIRRARAQDRIVAQGLWLLLFAVLTLLGIWLMRSALVGLLFPAAIVARRLWEYRADQVAATQRVLRRAGARHLT